MKKILIIVLLLLSITFIGGCDKKEDTSKKEETKEVEKKKEEKITLDESKYDKRNVDNLSYMVPNNWEYVNNNTYEYYYPVKGDRSAFLMVNTNNVGEKNIKQNDFGAFINSYADSLTTNESLKNARIIKQEVSKKDDFWIADIEYKGEMINSYYHFINRLLYDNKTGIVYNFTFIQKDKVSEEYSKEFTNILSSIELR